MGYVDTDVGPIPVVSFTGEPIGEQRWGDLVTVTRRRASARHWRPESTDTPTIAAWLRSEQIDHTEFADLSLDEPGG